jgi:1-acylglycerone phosphate reductase
MEGFKDPTIEKLSLDVTNDADVQRVVKTILLHGPIDILVNNAGVMAAGPLNGWTNKIFTPDLSFQVH